MKSTVRPSSTPMAEQHVLAQPHPAPEALGPLEIGDDLVDLGQLRPLGLRGADPRGVGGAHAHGERVGQGVAIEAREQLRQVGARLELGQRLGARDEAHRRHVGIGAQRALHALRVLAVGVEREVDVHVRIGVEPGGHRAHAAQHDRGDHRQRDGEREHEHRDRGAEGLRGEPAHRVGEGEPVQPAAIASWGRLPGDHARGEADAPAAAAAPRSPRRGSTAAPSRRPGGTRRRAPRSRARIRRRGCPSARRR